VKKPRFSKLDWIRHGLEQLASDGHEAVKLEAICTSAGLTRGSFYHHFEDHESFLINLATHWFDAQTAEVAAAVEPDASPEDQSAALTEAAITIDYRLELGIRELGRRLPEVDKTIRQADALRLEVVSALYQRRFGLDPKTADDFAYIEYAAFSGIILLDPDIAPERQIALARLYDKTVGLALKSESGT